MITQYDKMTVRGDLILEGAQVKNNLNIQRAQIDGLLDLDEVNVGGELNLQGANYKILEKEDMVVNGKLTANFEITDL